MITIIYLIALTTIRYVCIFVFDCNNLASACTDPASYKDLACQPHSHKLPINLQARQ